MSHICTRRKKITKDRTIEMEKILIYKGKQEKLIEIERDLCEKQEDCYHLSANLNGSLNIFQPKHTITMIFQTKLSQINKNRHKTHITGISHTVLWPHRHSSHMKFAYKLPSEAHNPSADSRPVNLLRVSIVIA